MPPHMDVVRIDLSLGMKRGVFRSSNMRSNYAGKVGKGGRSSTQIFDVLEAAGQRSTTKADDEWIVLATALNISTVALLLYKDQERAKAFYVQMGLIPRSDILPLRKTDIGQFYVGTSDSATPRSFTLR